MHTPSPDLIYVIAASLLALMGALSDVRTRRIPNWMTLPGALVGLLLHFGIDGWRGLGSAAAAALIAGVIFLIFYIAGGMGAGDVKLMTAVASLAGLHFVIEMLIATAIAGGVFGLVLVIARGRLKQTLVNVTVLAVHHRTAGLEPHPELNVRNPQTLRLPYGIAIAAGCFAALATRLLQRHHA